MRLIGLSGKLKSGKTLTADFLALYPNYIRVSFARALKDKVQADFDFTTKQVCGIEKDYVDERYGVTPRVILIETGRFYRKFDPLFWVKQLKKQLLAFPQAQLLTFVIDDVRFPNEAEFIREHNGVLVRLERDNNLRGADLDDPSEKALDAYNEWDLRIMPYENVTPYDAEKNAHRIHTIIEQRFPRR